jgi:hypothetical protein
MVAAEGWACPAIAIPPLLITIAVPWAGKRTLCT